MKLTILSNSAEPFADRDEAGMELGNILRQRISESPLILGVPRGGIVTASAIAAVLDCDVDILLAHKIRAPFNPELAVGAMSEDGHVVLSANLVQALEADSTYIEQETNEQREELNRRRKLFRSVYPKIPLRDRVVIITDDGVATGATIQAALWAARREKPQKLIGAFPVAPPETLEKLKADADEIICLKVPAMFYAISQFYLAFDQVPDSEVLEILRKERRRKEARDKKQPAPIRRKGNDH